MTDVALNESDVMGTCRCCQERKPLRLSHIISKLAYRRMKRFPGQNRLVQGQSEIVQDGPKRPLLCDGCEQMLGTSERLFNNQFLTPYYKAKVFQAEYGPWLAKFAAANIWRVLIASIEDAQIPTRLYSTAAAAERAWRAFIRDESRDCAPHNLHLVLIDNRPEWAAYAEGAIEYSVVADESAREAYLITKLPGLAIDRDSVRA